MTVNESTTPARTARLWTLLLVVLSVPFFMLMQGFGFGVAAGIKLSQEGGDLSDADAVAEAITALTQSVAGTTIGILTMSIFLAFVALSAAALSPIALKERLGLLRPRFLKGRLAASLIVVCLGALAVGSLGDAIIALAGRELSEGLRAMAEAVTKASGAKLLVLSFAMCVLAPLAEEMFFRGYLQRRLIARLGSLAGIAISSLLFGLVHLDWMHIPFAALIGVFLGWVCYRSGSILPAIAGHMANNIAYVLSVRAGLEVAEASLLTGAAVLLGSVTVAIFCIQALKRRTDPTETEAEASLHEEIALTIPQDR